MNAHSIVKVTGSAHTTLLNGLAVRKMYNLENVRLFGKYITVRLFFFWHIKCVASRSEFSILMKMYFANKTRKKMQ